MSIFSNVRGIISRRKKLGDLKVDELQTARIQLEREQSRVLRQIDELEEEKAELDTKGRAERSARKQQILAQQILQIETKAKHHDRNLAVFSRQLRIIDGFIFLKENQRALANTPLWNMISKMDTAELQAYMDQATIDGSFQLEKLNQLLGVFDEDEALFRAEEDDPRIKDIMNTWQKDQESGFVVPEIDDSLFDREEDEREG